MSTAPAFMRVRRLWIFAAVSGGIWSLLRLALSPYGIDLSEVAVETARQNYRLAVGEDIPEADLACGSVTGLPWQESTFDLVGSHGVLDSMPFDTAEAAVKEVSRVLKSGGLMYLDLIAGVDGIRGHESHGEDVVQTEHERDTMQSYSN